MLRLIKPPITDATKGRSRGWDTVATTQPDRPLQILAIDPGTAHSGLVYTTDFDIVYADGGISNDDTIDCIRSWSWDYLLIEEIVTSFGRPRGKGKGSAAIGIETFRCQLWAGVFFSHALQVADNRGSVRLLPRTDMLRYYRRAGERSANDSTIRESILDRYKPTGGGGVPQVGTSKAPGPLYGVANHAWQALSLAVYFLEHDRNKVSPQQLVVLASSTERR